MRLLTLNLRQDLDRWPERLPLVVAALAEADADVIALQEVALPIEQDALLAEALGGYAVHRAPKWGDANAEAVSLLTRVPVEAHEVLELPGPGGRVAQRIEVGHDGRALHVVNTHLHHEPFDDESVREPQLRAILGWLRDRGSLASCVLLGDLNATPGSSTLTAARESLTGVLPEHLPTFPTGLATASFAPVQIDHVLHSPGLRVTHARVVADRPAEDDPRLYPSDHVGILAELASTTVTLGS